MRLLVILLLGCGSGPDTGPATGFATGLGNELVSSRAHFEESIQESPVPVLLFPERYAATSVVSRGPRWVAVSHHQEHELTISIHATDVVHNRLSDRELQRVPPAFHEVRGEPARTTINEGIRAVTWSHQGVAYSLEVECYRVLEDARCADPYWALDLADELVQVRR